MLWFLLGQHFGTRRLIQLLLAGALVLSVIVAGYGLWQTRIRTSVPSWDRSWIQITGYDALYVGGQNVATEVRPFSTFSSNAEYAAYLSSGIIIALGFALRRRVIGLVAVPLLAYALFHAGGRSVIVLTLVGIVTLFALTARRLQRGVVVFVAGIAIAIGAGSVFGSSLDRAAATSGDAITQRNVTGILNPFNSTSSTLPVPLHQLGERHCERRHPSARGRRRGNQSRKLPALWHWHVITDNDVSDVFVSLGVLGGVAYVAVIILVFRRVFSAYARSKDMLLLVIGGLLVVNLEHWLQGGYYAIAPLFWFVVGWACRESPVQAGRSLVDSRSAVSRDVVVDPAARPPSAARREERQVT